MCGCEGGACEGGGLRAPQYLTALVESGHQSCRFLLGQWRVQTGFECDHWEGEVRNRVKSKSED